MINRNHPKAPEAIVINAEYYRQWLKSIEDCSCKFDKDDKNSSPNEAIKSWIQETKLKFHNSTSSTTTKISSSKAAEEGQKLIEVMEAELIAVICRANELATGKKYLKKY